MPVSTTTMGTLRSFPAEVEHLTKLASGMPFPVIKDGTFSCGLSQAGLRQLGTKPIAIYVTSAVASTV